MLQAIRRFFERNIAPQSAHDEGHALRLATASLLLEMSRQDETVTAPERTAMLEAVRAKFELPPDEAEELIRLAEAESAEATDYYQFTALINRHFNPAQKVKVIELLWQVAWADRDIDRYEEHMVRKVAELLYVSHADFIAAKLRVLAACRT